jgi:hypothetical protein
VRFLLGIGTFSSKLDCFTRLFAFYWGLNRAG